MPIPAARSIVPVHLLLIDDNSLGLQARKAVLEEYGYRVATVASAEEALTQLADVRFDLVVTDYKLPGMTGVQLIQEIRKRGLQLHVVLLSGFVDAMGLTERNTDADLVLQKSSNEVSQLVRSVKSLLRKAAIKKPPSPERPGPNSSRKKA
jgi:CheY-like chemotaxis protein